MKTCRRTPMSTSTLVTAFDMPIAVGNSLDGLCWLIRHSAVGEQADSATDNDAIAFHSQYSTLIIRQQQTLHAEILQQCLDLIILKLDDLLLAFVVPANEGGKQKVVGLDDEMGESV